MLSSFDNYIFDMDGTVINSSGEILKCLKQAFQDANCAIDEALLVSDIIGPPIPQIIKLVKNDIDDNTLEKVILNFRKIYDFDLNDISYLYDGIYKYLTTLKELNKRLFIATFKPNIPTQRLINEFKLNMFDEIYTIDSPAKFTTKTEMLENILSRYRLDKTKTVMIGDAPSDMTAAKNNGIYAVGALWGYGTDKTKLINNADICINNIEELKCQKLNYQTI